jgi:anti-anti-sigma factor
MPEAFHTAFLEFLAGQREAITRAITGECVEKIALYRALPPDMAARAVGDTVELTIQALANGDVDALIRWVEQRILVRMQEGLTLPQALLLPAIFRRHLLAFALPAVVRAITGATDGTLFLSAMCDRATDFMGEFYNREHHAQEQERVRLQQEIIDMQELALRELSTPLLSVSDGVVVLPLVGSIDSRRARQVVETLLEGIIASKADTAILDITGVPVVDTQVAGALLQAAQGVRLLGARIVLTGIRPEVAQTLVGLGADLGEIVSRSTLQSGIAYALSKRPAQADSSRSIASFSSINGGAIRR